MRLRLVFFALVAAVMSAPAAAQPESDLPQAMIRFGDLDLTTDAGLARLRTRVSTEIARMCSVEGHELSIRRLRRECIETASSSAEIGIARAVASAREHGGPQLAAR